MNELFNIILIIIVLIVAYHIIHYNKNNNLKNNIEKLTDINQQYNNIIVPNNVITLEKNIKFNYDIRPIDNEFIKEQKQGVNLNTWYPNTWIEKIDENGNPIYGSRESSDPFLIKQKTNSSYDFNNMKTENIDSVLKKEDVGKTIKEVYDNSIIDYKKLEPKKIMIGDENSDIIMPGGSNLTFFNSDTWTYENEKPENGGIIYDGIYANDELSNSVSVY
jgi:hypothetical protein